MFIIIISDDYQTKYLDVIIRKIYVVGTESTVCRMLSVIDASKDSSINLIKKYN